jgi:serine/threonine protein kinase
VEAINHKGEQNMSDLAPGYTIKTTNYKKIVVGKKLGEGGQGAVYQVDYDGKQKALKWYSGKKFNNAFKFYANLENNIKKGKPTKAFLWPEDITEKADSAFGYVMDLRPPEYKDFTKFLLGKERFASITAMCNASLHIIDGFGELHRKGYSYQDLNDGNFFINPKTGDVLICDNDNVSEAGSDSGIAGKARYMAPEIVAEGKKPNKYTDRFSLAVVLFLLWIKNHPLEGKAAFPVCMDASHDRKIYGENPVFIFDPNDSSNRPVQGLNKGAIQNWPQLPVYLQEQFTKAFSKETLKEPSKRVIELDFLRTFIRMRSEIYKCSCGEVYFADPENLNPCPSCKKQNSFSFYLKLGRYNVPVHQRTKLYACHTEKDSEDFQTITGEVAVNGNDFSLKNISSKNWTVTEDGNASSVAQEAVFTLKKGVKINFGNMQAEII